MKGVSPLIAAVLLILMSIVISVMVSSWLTTTTKEHADTISNKTNTKLSCQYSNIFIISASLNCTNDCASGTLHNFSLRVKNTGTNSISVNKFFVQNTTGNLLNLSLNETKLITPGSIVTLGNLTDTSCTGFDNTTRMDKIILNSITCPSNAYDSIEGDDVSFLSC